MENPELYAVFPFLLHGLGRGDAALARRSFEARTYTFRYGWQQNGIHAALTGDTEEARRDLLERVGMRHRDSWFPAYWTSNFDWAPDQDHGSAFMLTLQFMIRQDWHTQDLHLPAWPDGWTVEARFPDAGVIGTHNGNHVEKINPAD
jgi:hypothetical protein